MVCSAQPQQLKVDSFWPGWSCLRILASLSKLLGSRAKVSSQQNWSFCVCHTSSSWNIGIHRTVYWSCPEVQCCLGKRDTDNEGGEGQRLSPQLGRTRASQKVPMCNIQHNNFAFVIAKMERDPVQAHVDRERQYKAWKRSHMVCGAINSS